MVVDELMLIWRKARISTRYAAHCITQVEKLYEEWRILQKSAKRQTETQKQNEEFFSSKLDNSGVPNLQDGTGETIALSVSSLLQEWNILDKVEAMCFDTTSANAGHLNGACTFLQHYLDKKLLLLPCRHHIHYTYLSLS